MLKIHGLKNCDTCRTAVKWLEAEGIAYAFRDLRKDRVAEAEVERWAKAAGWETLLNRAGTTWRGLAHADRSDLDSGKAVLLMTAHVALMKRPIIDFGDEVIVGFKDAQKQAIKSRYR